jgi:carboxyl-terminal processing protease
VESLETGPVRHEADLRGALANPDKPADKDKPAAPPKTNDKSSDKGKPAPADRNVRGRTPAPAATDKETGKDDDEVATRSEGAIEDYQLSRALDLLRGIALYSTRVSN